MSGICSDPDIQEGAECLLGAKIITGLLEQTGVLNLRVWPSERRFSRSMLLTSRMISAFCWCVSVFESLLFIYAVLVCSFENLIITPKPRKL